MTILPIVIAGDPVLHNPTEPVTGPIPELAELIRDMYETMDAANGVGLAANQVGRSLRLFVYDCPDENGDFQRGCVINPVLETSEIPKGMPADDGTDDEGCLSIPGINAATERYLRVRATGQDRTGTPVTIEAEGLLARCIQHETDHLDGVLFLRRLTPELRKDAMAQIRTSEWFNK